MNILWLITLCLKRLVCIVEIHVVVSISLIYQLNAHIQLNIYIMIYQTSPTYLGACCTIRRETLITCLELSAYANVVTLVVKRVIYRVRVLQRYSQLLEQYLALCYA